MSRGPVPEPRGVRRGALRAIQYLGTGRYPLQTIYTTDPKDLARAQAADPGHVRGVYWWHADGIANCYESATDAARAALKSRAP